MTLRHWVIGQEVQTSRNCRLLQIMAQYHPDTFVRNDGNRLPNDEALYLSRLESLTILKWKLQNLLTQRRYLSCSSALLSHKSCIFFKFNLMKLYHFCTSMCDCGIYPINTHFGDYVRIMLLCFLGRLEGWRMLCALHVLQWSVSLHMTCKR